MYKFSFSKNSPQPRSVAAAWLSALLAGLLCAVPAYAQQEDDDEDPPPVNEFEITPFLGLTAGGEFEDPNGSRDRDLDAAASYGVIAGFAADYNKHYELLFSNQSTEVEGTSNLDLDVQYLHVGGSVEFDPGNRRAIPFVAGGLGVTLLSPDRAGFNDETEFSLSFGGRI